MHTIAKIAALIAKLDDTPASKLSHLDKSLRNMTQRHYFPADAQDGRAFLYSEQNAVAIRLVHLAATFGLDRLRLDTLNRWLRNNATDETNLAEAIERAIRGETFSIHLIVDPRGAAWCEADWTPVREISPRVSAALKRVHPEIGRYTLPASNVIRDMIEVLRSEDV